jgi:hypothetical protein
MRLTDLINKLQDRESINEDPEVFIIDSQGKEVKIFDVVHWYNSTVIGIDALIKENE